MCLFNRNAARRFACSTSGRELPLEGTVVKRFQWGMGSPVLRKLQGRHMELSIERADLLTRLCVVEQELSALEHSINVADPTRTHRQGCTSPPRVRRYPGALSLSLACTSCDSAGLCGRMSSLNSSPPDTS